MPKTSASVIGEGSYGCVHKPQLTCMNNTKKNYKKNKFVSKFMLTKEALKELSEYTNISHIDKKKEFYLGKPVKCKPQTTPYNVNSFKKCDIYDNLRSFSKTKKNKKNIFSKFSLLVIPDGGTDITKFANSLLNDSSRNRVDKLELFWKNSMHILKGIQLFQKHGFLHYDVKPHNIVFNTKNGHLRFIDFGLMKKIKEITHLCKLSNNYFANYPFWTYPFENMYLNKEKFMKVAKLSFKEKTEYVTELFAKMKNKSSKLFISYNIFFDYVMHNYNEKHKQQMIERYLNDFMNFIKHEIKPDNYDEFLYKSIHTIDLFGVGITLQFMLSYSMNYFDSNKIAALEECFFNMMRPNVMYRYTIEEAITQYTQIMESNTNSLDPISIVNITKMDEKVSEKIVMKQEKLLDSLNK